MSKSRIATMASGSAEATASEPMLVILEKLESLLCCYAHYARETSAASVSLQRLGDIESSRILAAIMSCVDRCLWFIEIYLEGLALKTDGSQLPDWSPTYVDLRK